MTLTSTKELMAILAKQTTGGIPAQQVKAAITDLVGRNPCIARAEAVIAQLRGLTKHPALAAKIRDAESEVAEFHRLAATEQA